MGTENVTDSERHATYNQKGRTPPTIATANDYCSRQQKIFGWLSRKIAVSARHVYAHLLRNIKDYGTHHYSRAAGRSFGTLTKTIRSMIASANDNACVTTYPVKSVVHPTEISSRLFIRNTYLFNNINKFYRLAKINYF